MFAKNIFEEANQRDYLQRTGNYIFIYLLFYTIQEMFSLHNYQWINYQLFKQNMMFHGLSFHNAIGKYIHTHTNEWYEKWNLSWPVYSTAKSATPGFRYLHRMMFAAETTHRVFPFLIAHCTRNESRDKRTVQY